MVFLLTHLCEIDPFFSRIFLAELKKARLFSFRGKNNKEAAPGYAFGFVVAKTIKQLLKTKQNRQLRLACTWIQSPENDRENRKVSSASASRDQPRNVPVKSKLQHPPRAVEFLENLYSNFPFPGLKSCSNAPTRTCLRGRSGGLFHWQRLVIAPRKLLFIL